MHSKVFEQSLISFVERLMHKTESLLIEVSGHALKLKMMTGNELEKSIEALDLTCNRQSGVASSVSCNDFFILFRTHEEISTNASRNVSI